jgi:phosphoribosyl-ATP pyrophosphohydrolase / phosphoribosyl-AMP cyclohydrolase / histidinol dehydrogenase
MTSTPYVSFINNIPVGTNIDDNNIALVAVGRCRINITNTVQYKEIVQKNIEQAKILQLIKDSKGDDKEKEENNKKLCKKFMKQGVAMASTYLESVLLLDVSIIDVEIVINNYDIIQTNGCIAACFLDAGCDCIVLSYNNNDTNNTKLNDAFDIAQIPSSRLIASIGNTSSYDTIESIKRSIEEVKQYCTAVSILFCKEQKNSDLVIVSELLSLGCNELKMIIEINPNEFNTEDDNNEYYLPKLVGNWCTNEKECKNKKGIVIHDPSAIVLGKCYSSCIKTDRTDKLYTTVVCTRTNEALGLVYSSTESIIAALQCGRGVYYSRSRSSLWRKGDTSGNYQLLHRIDIDCDGDAVRFLVTQLGGTNNNNDHDHGGHGGSSSSGSFCHLNTLTCWGQSRGINQLQLTLQERLINAPEGSYTKRLFNDNKLLQNKLLEEVQELNEATSKNDVASELADVLYFAMVKAVQSNISFDDAIVQLDKRTRKVTRRQGDSKQERIINAQTILDSNNKDKEKDKEKN